MSGQLAATKNEKKFRSIGHVGHVEIVIQASFHGNNLHFETMSKHCGAMARFFNPSRIKPREHKKEEEYFIHRMTLKEHVKSSQT